jgi:hypothetical protein
VAEAYEEDLLDHDVTGDLVPDPVYPGGEGMDELSTEEFEEYNDTVYGYTPYVGYPAVMFTAKPRRKDHLYNESMGFEARFDTWCNFVSYSGSESHFLAGTYSSLVANSLSFDTYGGTSGSVKPIGVGSLTVYVITTTNEVEPITFSSVFHLPQPDVPPFILMGRNRLEELGWTATAGIKALERSSTRQLIRLRSSRVATTIFTVYRSMELAAAAISHTTKVKMSAAEVHLLTGHSGDDDMKAWAAAYNVHLDGDFTSARCHPCLISNIAKTALREAHTHPEVSPVDKSTCLVMDFNVWLGAKNPGKARSGNKQLLNVIHPKTLTVMTVGT